MGRNTWCSGKYQFVEGRVGTFYFELGGDRLIIPLPRRDTVGNWSLEIERCAMRNDRLRETDYESSRKSGCCEDFNRTDRRVRSITVTRCIPR
jgi:hypothetical protein